MLEKLSKKDVFASPNIQAEKSEFERVAKKFGIDVSVLTFLAERYGKLTELNDDIWSQLKNTDSYKVPVDGHDTAEIYATIAGRNYHAVAEAVYAGVSLGKQLDAPIIIKCGEEYHLVSGNTRLMATRAYGVIPNVWIFEVDKNEALV